MWPAEPAFDIDALRQTVDDYRNRVCSGPANMRARVDLAWYLLLLAVHEAGREHGAGQGATDPSAGHGPHVKSDGAPDLASRALLRESARQAAIVTQLSCDPQTRSQAASLKEIARTVNAEWAVYEAECEAANALADLSRAVLSPGLRPRGGPGKQPH